MLESAAASVVRDGPSGQKAETGILDDGAAGIDVLFQRWSNCECGGLAGCSKHTRRFCAEDGSPKAVQSGAGGCSGNVAGGDSRDRFTGAWSVNADAI